MREWWKEKAWPWLKKWGAAILGVLGLLIGAGWAWGRYKRKLGAVRDQLTVAEATKKIAELRAVRTEIASRVEEKDEAIEVIDRKLLENQRKIVEAHEGGEGLSDEEMLAAFKELGI